MPSGLVLFGVNSRRTRPEASGLAMRASSDTLPEWVASEDPSMIKAFAALAFLSSLLSFHVPDAMAENVPRNVVAELAPSGKLRAAINFGNSVLAQKDPATGEPRGVSAGLAREVAKRLGVPISFVGFDAAGKVTEAVKTGALDICFLAIDPV